MKPMMISEDEKAYTIQDKAGQFKVPKGGLSKDMHAKIRGLAATKMFDGGQAVPPPEFSFDPSQMPQQFYTPPSNQPMVLAPPVVPAQPLGQSRAPYAPSPPEEYKPSDEGLDVNAKVAEIIADKDKTLIDRKKQAELEAKHWPPAVTTSIDYEGLPTVPAKQQAGSRGGGYSIPNDGSGDEQRRAIEEQKSLIRGAGEIEAEAAKAKAGVFDAQLRENQIHALREQEMQQRAKLAAGDAMKRIKVAQDDLAKADTSIDTGRYWASRGTGGKIAGIIGLALGTIGAGNDGINRASALLNQAIDRDLEAQKAEHTLALQNGKAAIEGAQSIYALTREAAGDDIAASASAKAAMLERADLQMKQIMASTQSPLAKNNAAMMSAKLSEQMGQLRAQEADRLFQKNHVKVMERQGQQQIDTARAKAGGAGHADPKLYKQQQLAAADSIAALEDLEASIDRSGTWELFGSESSKRGQALDKYAVGITKFADPTSVVSMNEIKSKIAALGVDKDTFFQDDDVAKALIRNEIKNIKDRMGRINTQGTGAM